MKLLRKILNNNKDQIFIGFKKEEFKISKDDLVLAIKTCGYEIYNLEFLNLLAMKINDKLYSLNEVSMFLAHCIHETGGFQYREELVAMQNPNLAQKMYALPEYEVSKSYHGRGILMLSWGYNYNNASIDLGLGNELLLYPEQVSLDDNLSIDTGLWYWTKIVRNSNDVSDFNFYQTTLTINGAIESTTEGKKKAKHRYDLYKKIANVFNVKNIAKK